jgi:YVTN family beta-propeller protein
MNRRVLRVRLLFAIALGLVSVVCAFLGACKGGVIDAGSLCDVSPAPVGLGTAPIYAHVAFDPDGGRHTAAEGGTIVLPGGRLLSPITPTFGRLGFPVSVVAHPRLPVAYVVDMDYGAYSGNPSARCFGVGDDGGDDIVDAGADVVVPGDSGVPVRGIHVMDLVGQQELQGPAGIAVPLIVGQQAAFNNPGSLCALGKSYVAPHDASYGIAITRNATPAHLYLSTGLSGFVYEYLVNEPVGGSAADGGGDAGVAGTLTPLRSIYVGGYTAGLALTADEQRLWVVQFVSSSNPGGSSLVEVLLDEEAGLGRQISLPLQGGYAVAVSPPDGADAGASAASERVYVSGFRRGDLYSVDPAVALEDGGEPTTSIPVGRNPEAVAVSQDGRYVFVAVSDDDTVVALDTLEGGVTVANVAGDLTDEIGIVPGSSPSALTLDPTTNRLYVARAADNAVSVLDTTPGAKLASLGTIPVGFYPTGVAVSTAGLVVTHGKGLTYDWAYAEPDAGGAGFEGQGLQGSMLVAPTDALDGGAIVTRNITAAAAGDSFTCDGRFPVPRYAGTSSPIQHIVLIVRENKTYDFLLGGTDGDDAGSPFQIDNLRRAEGLCDASDSCPLVPNIQALAAQFASEANFYDESEVSMTGHAWLTGSYVNDYLQRAFTEANGATSLIGFDFADETGFPPAEPGPGTFFEELLKYDVDFVVLGELTGVFGSYGGQFVLNHVDLQYPGHGWDLSVSDIDRANYAVNRLTGDGGSFPPFVYMELQRDHTNGTGPGVPTPASMIAENDYATGLFVQGISQSPYWASTAIFIVEDDPQLGYDHVDYHRAICVVASPWAKHPHYTSHVHAGFPSLFRTFELMLDLPRMNRFDAYAMPLRDMFTKDPDFTPYDASALAVPLTYNVPSSPSLDVVVSSLTDFSHPDGNPLLGEVVWKSLTGDFPPSSRILDLARRGELNEFLAHVGRNGDRDGDDH